MRFLPVIAAATAATAIHISPSTAARSITTKALMGNLRSLADIAAANGGNRAFGLPGYEASVDFVLSRLAKYKQYIKYSKQEFTALFAIVDAIQLNEVGSTESVYVFGLTYSPSTTAEGITAPLVLGPAGLAGCDAANYAGLEVTDKIVLVQRFRCPDGTTLAGRVRPAVAAGAAAVIVYNDVSTKPTAGTLSAPDPVAYRPAGYITQADGEAWKARLEAGEALTVFFQQTQTIESRATWNVIAETIGGHPNDVIGFGAHLDSVQAGPGINDDGSGTSLVLELVRALAEQRVQPRHKLRFFWWGAEENGLLGSEHYVATLPADALAQTLAYLNFDMVARGYYGVFDGDGSTHNLTGPPGSGAIEALLSEYLSQQEGVEVTPAVFTGGSDYAPFMEAGVAVGGLHTGTGVAQDDCYHQECDGYENANATVLTRNAKAAAWVMATLANKAAEIIPARNQTAGMRKLVDGGIAWDVEEGGRHVGCGGKGDV
ncbi:hypothetical protein EDC01DRAFT_643762 [Geopyxis carbonaria]|nr:hypothetical protein EDC01DRAFT_643762 [Geopyxis carbonaria]